jgi:hypothetical protein
MYCYCYIFISFDEPSTMKTLTSSSCCFLPKGYFTFEECPGVMNPTIGIEVGQTYTFIQADRSNWYHPMGFAYFPDGAHDDKDELEPGVSQTSSNCVSNNTCPTPRYFRGGEFLGNGVDSADFGLDVYEPEFFRSVVEWSGKGPYTIQLNFDDETYTKDIFYFCHVRCDVEPVIVASCLF